MLVNCKTCGKLFPGQGQFGLCANCQIKEQSEAQKVNEYLLIRPDASLEDVATRTGVPRANIVRLMRDGKLNLQHALTRCSRCNKTFENNKKSMCEDCLSQVAGDLRSELLAKTLQQKVKRGF